MIALYTFFGFAILLTATSLVLNTAAYERYNSQALKLRLKIAADKAAELSLCFWLCEYLVLFKLYL